MFWHCCAVAAAIACVTPSSKFFLCAGSNTERTATGSQAARLLRSWVRIPPGAWIFVCCECRVLSGRGLCDELFTRPEESYRLCCVVVCDLETSRMGAPYIYDISTLRVNDLDLLTHMNAEYGRQFTGNMYCIAVCVTIRHVVRQEFADALERRETSDCEGNP